MPKNWIKPLQRLLAGPKRKRHDAKTKRGRLGKLLQKGPGGLVQ